MSKLLVITGASKGIGKATAKQFIDNAWSVINISRSNCDLPDVTNLKVDLTQRASVKQINSDLENLVRNAEQVCLVHNAAVYLKDSIQTIDADEFATSLEANLIAPVILNQILLPQMQRGSSIIYIGSTLSEKAVPNASSYVTSKHAIAGLMKATCQDLAGTSIHTCCICPGLTDTEMLQQHFQNNSQALNQIIENVAMKRLVKTEEIAELVYHCANHPVTNGAMLHANLGQVEF